MVKRSAGILAIGILTSVPMILPGQGDPFAADEGAFSAAPGAAASPFDAAPADGSSSPFDTAPPAGGAPAAADPFAEPAPAAAAAAPADAAPFGAPNAADPFGAPATTNAADPFGAPAAPAAPGAAVASDPFATEFDPAAAGAAPMTAGAAPAGGADPFGGGAPTASDPFSAPAAPAAGGSPFAGIFGGGAEGAPADGTATTADGAAAPSGTGITTLYDFRYFEVPRINGTTVVVRRRMTWDEAAALDESRRKDFQERVGKGEFNAYQPGVASTADWAAWLYYAEQLDLWRRYCVEVMLADTDITLDEFAIVWPGDPTEEEETTGSGGEGGEFSEGGGGGRPSGGSARPSQQGTGSGRNIFNENRDIDTQVNDFFTASPPQQAPDGREVWDPSIMNNQAVTMYKEFFTRLRQQEKDQMAFINQFSKALEQRKLQREAYANWRAAQMQAILEYKDEWERQYNGRVTTIAGVRYELYSPDNVPGFTTRGANVVITDYDLTPYDILNEDGSLRGPAR